MKSVNPNPNLAIKKLTKSLHKGGFLAPIAGFCFCFYQLAFRHYCFYPVICTKSGFMRLLI
jgi:hypothetical protein